MKQKILLIVILSLCCNYIAKAQLSARVETGVVFNGYNDVAVSGEAGTHFSLTNDLKGNPSAYYRLSLGYSLGEKHHLSALFSPLDMSYHGSFNRDVFFVNTLFPSETEVKAKYRFYSYRLTYRYDIVQREKLTVGLGLTAKIREARISLSTTELYEEKSNVGFVPIIHFHVNWQYHKQWSLLFEGDALAVPQGRAEDVLLATTYALKPDMKIYLGYRLLEGGSDSESVYTFSMFHYISIGLQIKITKSN